MRKGRPFEKMLAVWDDQTRNKRHLGHIYSMIAKHGADPMTITSARGTPNGWVVQLERNGKPMYFGIEGQLTRDINWADLRPFTK